jgi:two-component system LytT family sensor kinase
MLLCLVLVLARVTNSTRSLYDWSMSESSAAATAQADADAARLRALQVQMNPRFLFNALDTVTSLLGNDDSRGRRTVRNLTAILKHTLERSTKPLTTVEDEVRFVRDYLDIERERFGSRLQVTYAVDPGTSTMAIPTMSLQPLVENAIKHAVTERLEGGHIRVSATRGLMPPLLRLVVEDDGPGFGPHIVEGTGLKNLRARLATLYGQEATLLTETIDGGARVSVTVPNTPLLPEADAGPDR